MKKKKVKVIKKAVMFLLEEKYINKLSRLAKKQKIRKSEVLKNLINGA